VRRTAFLVSTAASPSVPTEATSPIDDARRQDGPARVVDSQRRRQRPQVDGATALHWAVYRDDPEAADWLIRAGAKVDGPIATVSPRWGWRRSTDIPR
jgi:hypothetical protein